MDRLYTIGYEKTGLPEFLATLEEAEIDLLLDVRERPMSRRKGFSKTPLSDALAEVGIDYRNERELGVLKPVRDRVKQDRDYDTFFREYREHLWQRKSLLASLADELDGNVTLMCYERDPGYCHRLIVAEEFGRRLDLEPVHLYVEGTD